MPRVPSVSLNTQQQPTFQAAQIAPVEDVTTKNIVSAGQGVGQLGKATLTYGDYLEDSINDAMVTKAWNDYRTNAMRMANDPETGFLSQKGQSALEGYKAARENLQGLIKSQESGLLNDFQRQMFRQQAQLYESEMMLRYDAHAAKETTDFKLNETNRQIDSFAQDYALLMANPIPEVTDPDGNPMPQDPTQQRLRPEAVLQAAQDKLRESWKLQKISPDSEEAKGQMRKLTSGMHKSAIEAFMAKDDDASASSYLEQHRAEMRGDDVVSLQSRLTNLQDANRAKEANRTGIRLVEQVSDSLEGYDAQYNALFSMYMRDDNPISQQEFNAAVAYLNNKTRSSKEEMDAQATAVFNQAEELAIGAPYHTAEEFFKANPGVEDSLRKTGQYDEFVQNYGTRKYVRTSQVALNTLEQMSNSGQLQRMSDIEFRKTFYTQLSKDDYDFWNAQRAPEGKRSADQARVITEKRAADNLLARQPWYRTDAQIKASIKNDATVADAIAARNQMAGLWQEHMNQRLQTQTEAQKSLPYDQRLAAAHESLLKEPKVRVKVAGIDGDIMLPESLVDPMVTASTREIGQIGEMDNRLYQGLKYYISAGMPAGDVWDDSQMTQWVANRKYVAGKYPESISPDVLNKELGITPEQLISRLPDDIEGLMYQAGLPSALNPDGTVPAWVAVTHAAGVADEVRKMGRWPEGWSPEKIKAYQEWSTGTPSRWMKQFTPSYFEIRRAGL